MGDSAAHHKKHQNMAYHVKIERDDDKTYWVPIPIHRVEDVGTEDQRNKQQAQGYSQPSTQKPVDIRVNQPSHKQKNSQNDDDDIFSRKRRSDLYDEIESRKFLSK